MRHIPTQGRGLGQATAAQPARPLPPPVVCSWYLADRVTSVELSWNPRHAQRTFREEGGFGLLLGIATPGPPRSLQIRRVVGAAGPSPEPPAAQVSGADTGALLSRLVQRLEDSGERVLGHYRVLPAAPVHSSAPTDEDERIVQESCSAPPGLVLLLRWSGDQLAGAFYLWDEAGLQPASSMLLPSPPPTVPFAPVIPAPIARPLNRKSLIAGILCGAFLATIAMTAFNLLRQSGSAGTKPPEEPAVLTRPPQAGSANAAPLGVTAAGGMLQIRWDPSSPAIRSSDTAHVAIVDGAVLKTIYLSASQLRTGLLLYSPKNAFVTVSLVGVKDGRIVVESVVSVGAPPAQPAAVPKPAESVTDTPPAPSQKSAEVPQPEPLPVAAPGFAVDSPLLAREVPVPPPPVAAVTGTPNRASQPVNPVRLETPAGLSLAPQASPAIPQTAAPAGTQSSLTPARPRYPILLPPADALRRLLVTSVTIPVTVQIASSGKVTSVAADTPDNLSGALASLAMAAVKNHTFEPARRDGVPVPSQLIVMFRFTRK